MDKVRVALLTFLLSLAFAASAQAAITMNILDQFGAYAGGRPLVGRIVIDYNQLINNTSFLVTLIDGSAVSSISMAPYVEKPEFYDYKKQDFDYNLTRRGTNTWTEKPDVSFNYIISVTCTSPSQGQWSADGPLTSCSAPLCTLSNKDGLKFIKDGKSQITPPSDCTNTVWSVTDFSNQVDTTMRQACGSQTYATQPVDSDGWVRRTLIQAELQGIPGTSDCRAETEPFDGDSLVEPGRRRFIDRPCEGSICGGIYKDSGLGPVYQTSPNQVEWDGAQGLITIHGCDKDLIYTITYLTPNGPNLCAYTSFSQQNSSSWTVRATQTNNRVDYKTPFRKAYTNQELEFLVPPPNCPAGTTDCVKNTIEFDSVETRDPSNTVAVQFNKATNTTTATTTSTDLTSTYTTNISFGDIPNLRAPGLLGPHTLTFRVSYQGSIIAQNNSQFITCFDADGDGYCTQSGDCDDSNPALNPGAAELCNGADENCNNQIDETFQEPGKLLGTPCNNWPGSVCAGVWACSPNSLSVMCNGRYQPGELIEICDDSFDNDCDGVKDEITEFGITGPACGCRNGETRICGGFGQCAGGYRICVNNQWSDCINATASTQEVCNNRDDNCDGITDNIGTLGGQSACGCSLGQQPKLETCNDIDDNCNGLVDDGISCCQDGETRSCGQNIGVCTTGTQTCFGGSWADCSGVGSNPTGEICGDNLDNDCDASLEEDCDSCYNNIQDTDEEGVDCGGHCSRLCGEFNVWISFAVIGVVLILIVGFLAWRGRL